MEAQITYIAMSLADFQKAVEDAALPDRLIRESTALKQFDMSRNFFNELIKEGKITRQAIPGKFNSYRYSEKQIRQNYKPL